jgi:AGZA family xanthine/uracil permease-like MFS transporter
MANGIGSVVASMFGSVSTTIYIIIRWKRLGKRSGYSSLNGIFIAFLCFTGTIQAVLGLIPLEAGIGILLYIGIIIVAQSFQETPKEHAPAVALGLVPALAGWGLMMVETGLRAAGTSLYEVGLGKFSHESVAIHGMIRWSAAFYFDDSPPSACADRQKVARAGCGRSQRRASPAVYPCYQLTAGGITSRFGLMAAPEFLSPTRDGGHIFVISGSPSVSGRASARYPAWVLVRSGSPPWCLAYSSLLIWVTSRAITVTV